MLRDQLERLLIAAALDTAKDRSLTAHRYPTSAWQAFLAAIRSGEFTER